MPKFYVGLAGTVPVKWGIEIEAATRDIAEAEALASAPRLQPVSWSVGTEVEGVFVDEVEELNPAPKDIDLGRRELEAKYMGDACWGHHPIHRRDLWKHCVAVDDTVSSYWDWVYDKIQNEDEPDEPV